MDIENSATRMAIAAFFVALSKGQGLTQALADLYEAGREDGREAVLDDPQGHNLVRLPC